jgi:hypothetical protein
MIYKFVRVFVHIRPGVRIPAAPIDFLFSKTVQTGYGAHPASYSAVTRIFYPEVKAPGREVDHSPTLLTLNL